MLIKKKKKNNEIVFNTKSNANFDDLLEKPLQKKYLIFILFLFFWSFQYFFENFMKCKLLKEIFLLKGQKIILLNPKFYFLIEE
jgi:hypothetical protein